MEPGSTEDIGGPGRDLTTCLNQSKPKGNPKKQVTAPKAQTDREQDNSEQSVNQQTLLNTSSSDWGQLDLDKGINAISPHGPSWEGPRTLLIVHHEP